MRIAIYASEFDGYPLAIWVAMKQLEDRYKGVYARGYADGSFHMFSVSNIQVSFHNPRDIPISARKVSVHLCGMCRNCTTQ